jgi:hypothetical protein
MGKKADMKNGRGSMRGRKKKEEGSYKKWVDK